MPSPFPGMDPYLENPWLWPDAHHGLITACQELLNRHIRPNYVARVEERVYLERDDDPARKELYVVPDIRVAKRPGGRKAMKKPKARGNLAVAEPVAVIFEGDLELREARIEVITTDTRAVVAVIEILSPTNKVRGSEGRESFQRKRREVLRSTAHWVEIDLLRTGERVSFRDHLDPHEYLAYASPADDRPNGVAWPIRLTEPLPKIGIPLRAPDPDAPLNLQEALSLAYERAAYDMTIDYTNSPTPPLSPDLDTWADTLLKQKGLR